MRVEEVMSAAGFTSHGHPVTDESITIACDDCQMFSRLSDCPLADVRIEEEGEPLDVMQTEYRCPGCGSIVLTVGPALYIDDSLRLGEWGIRLTSTMDFELPKPRD